MPTQKGGKEFETGLIIVKTDSSQRLGERERERERSTDDWALESPLKRPPNQTKTSPDSYLLYVHSFCILSLCGYGSVFDFFILKISLWQI
jgi:hypothetical protein